MGIEERDRKLTESGRTAVRKLAELLYGAGLSPDHIICSPLARALETARILADRLGTSDRVTVDHRLAHGCTFGELQDFVKEAGPFQRLMIVGHQPDMGRFAFTLANTVNINVPPGCLIRIDLDEVRPGGGAVKWLIPPDAVDPAN